MSFIVVSFNKGIVHVQDNLCHLGPDKAIRGATFGKQLAQQRTAEVDPNLGAMGASLLVGHATTAAAVEEGSEEQRHDSQVKKFVEDLLGRIWGVIVAHPGMIAADDKMGASKILVVSLNARDGFALF
jgi:hypothetical protein